MASTTGAMIKKGVSGFRSKLIDFLSEEEDLPEARRSSPHTDQSPLAGGQRFQEDLNKALERHETVPVGAVHVVAFTGLRAKLGDQWERVQQHVHQVAERIITSRLPPGSSYLASADSYLMVLPDLREEEARTLCALFAREIEHEVLGEASSSGQIEVRSAVRQVDRADAARDGLADRVLEAVIVEEEDKPPLPEQPIRLVYQPLLDVRREAVTAYCCIPSRISRYGRLQLGAAALVSRSGATPDTAYLDRHSINRAIRDLFRMHDEDRKLLLVIPVHFDTLAGQVSRAVYMDLCKGIPAPMRKLVLFELLRPPEGVPPSRLAEICSLLKRFARGVLVRLSPEWTDMPSVKGAGILGAGLDASEVATGLGPVLQRFGALAEKNRLVSFVLNVRAPAVAAAAVSAGYSFIGGDAVGPICPSPEGIYKCSLESVTGARPGSG